MELAQYDIFNRLRPVSTKGKALDERATLLKYFLENLRDKQGKPYNAGFIGMKLSHLEVTDLYYMQSVLTSETKRGQPFGKIFWGMLK